MAWKNQGGSPWGPGPKGPWGSGPQSQGPKPSDLEDLLRRGQDRIQNLMPGGHMSGMGIALIVAGLFRIWSGFALRPIKGWGWIALGGLVTLLAGLVIMAGWPVNSLWILGLFLAIDITMQGLALIAFGVLAKA